MNAFEQELRARLEAIKEQGLYRELRAIDSPQQTSIRAEGRSYLNFSSNDYLGLASHPALKQAAQAAVERYGAGGGASRLICGSLAPHHELEETLTRFKGTEAALSFSSGYTAALGTISALLGKQDVLVIDRLCHASIVDAARLCGGKLRVFRHNDPDSLASILKALDTRNPGSASAGLRSRVLIVTESVFSMDGDHAPLPELIALKEKFGAWLMVDEAHATGLYGPSRRGLAEEMGVAEKIDVQMGTLGKAFGSAGGYICGSHTLIHLLINKARSFIFSTAPVPAAAAAAAEGIRQAASEAGEERRLKLWQRVSEICDGLQRHGCQKSAIIPLIIGSESEALCAAASLRKSGIFVPAIRFPTVARGAARLRVTVSAAHTREDIRHLLAALAELNLAPSTHISHG